MLDLTDSHCHLNNADFGTDTDAVVQRAFDAGVKRLVTIGTRLENTAELVALAHKYPNVFATVGVHPEYVAEREVSADEIAQAATSDEKIIALGEAGFDYFYDPDTKEAQRKLFKNHLIAARKTGLPVIIHTRCAEHDTMDALAEFPDVTGVLHCFSSNAELAKFGLERGWYLSASGILTFKKAQDIRDIFKDVPLNRLLVETDAPYLAPVPYRGKRNEPSFVVKTAETLAELKGVSLEDLAKITTENFLTLFTKAY
ncbi:MAG TPA: LuxR family transcriptional regulator [Alphaproteobacteria bacterium]|nr:LuxR family transcriptional regulator [Alphaproteobacteria bacterium]